MKCKHGCGRPANGSADICYTCVRLRDAMCSNGFSFPPSDHHPVDLGPLLSILDSLRPPWTPFKSVNLALQLTQQLAGFDPDLIKLVAEGECFLNSRYQVQLRFDEELPDQQAHLSIKSLDKNARHDWRDFQRIKNEILGLNWEAVELYPDDARLVDTSNQYHLWCWLGRFPIGFPSRLVAEDPGDMNVKQRLFEPDDRPEDLADLSRENINRIFAEMSDIG